MDFKLFNIDGYYFELTNTHDDKEYQCSFIEDRYGKRIEHYKSVLKSGSWIKIKKSYICNMFVEIRTMNGVLKNKISFLDHLKDKRVFISFDSSALGDSIAWMPYVLQFQQAYMCKVIVSTFKNWMFEDAYPELEFVNPGSKVDNIVSMVKLGWFWDKEKEPENPVLIPLQETATNILNLPYNEMIPRMAYKPKEFKHDKQYVCISTQSTAQLKLWDKWQELIDYLVDKGYDVFEISKEPSEFKNVIDPSNNSLEHVMDIIHGCKFYIGLSSGLSWLSWALRTPVVMISNFTEDNHEFECHRVTNHNVCNGCWNNPKFRFDKGNWNYCPEHEDTPRQHECHKSILASDVISVLENDQLI